MSQRSNSLLLSLFLLAPAAAQVPDRLQSPAPISYESFGASLDLEGDLLVVGAPAWIIGAAPGQAYVYRLDPTGWSYEATLTSSVATGSDGFGLAIALSGDRILVGASMDDAAGSKAGRAYVYEYQAPAWFEVARFDAPGSTSGGYFGWEVALEGNLAVVSAPNNQRVFIYTRDAAGLWSLDQEIVGTASWYGDSVAIDGGRIFVVSSPDIQVFEDVGGTWMQTDIISAPVGEYLLNVEVQGDLLAAAHVLTGCPDGGNCPSGDVFVFRDVGGTWTQEATLEGSNTPREAYLGRSLSVSDGRILAGTVGAEDYAGVNSPGAAYLFEQTPTGWRQQLRLRSLESKVFEYFGGWAVLDGERAVCSGQGYIDVAAGTVPGAVYTFEGLVPAMRHLCFGTNCPCDWAGGGGCRNSTANHYYANGGMLEYLGSTSVAADDLVLRSGDLPVNQFGLVFMGAGTTDVFLADGRRCVAPGAAGLFRFPVRNSGTLGAFDEGPGMVGTSTGFAAGGTIIVGSTWYFQTWYRDPGGPCGNGSNLTSAVAVTFTL